MSCVQAGKWPRIALGEIAVKRRGSVDPQKWLDETFELYSIPAYDAGQPEIVTGADIGSSKQLLEPDDVVISRIVPHIQRVWIVGPKGAYRQIGSGEWIAYRSERFLPQYLRHTLLSPAFHNSFMSTVAGVGGSLLRARPSAVAEIEVSCPPLVEQRRIAAILDKADAIRRKRQQAIALADDFLRSVFLETFGDPKKNPHGLRTEPLGEVATIHRGRFSPRPRNDPAYYGGDYPFIQTGDINRSYGYLTRWTQTLNKKGCGVSRAFPAGTVVIAIVGATIGETAILGQETYFPDSVIGISPKPEVLTPEFVEYALRYWKQTFRDQAPETARANINNETLKPLPFMIPPIDDQNSFSAIYRRVHKELHIKLLPDDDLFASLSQRAFRGEL